MGHGRLSLPMYDNIMIGFIIGVKSLCLHFCAFCLGSCRFVVAGPWCGSCAAPLRMFHRALCPMIPYLYDIEIR